MGRIIGAKLNPQILKKDLASLVGLTVLGIESYAVGDEVLVDQVNIVLGYPNEKILDILHDENTKRD